MHPVLASISLLILSNIFMTFAWYAHLRELSTKPWLLAALVSWGIALFEYLLQVPANRIGYTVLSVGQLKIMQEIITLGVFVPFAIFYLKEPLKLDYLWAGLCLLGAAYFAFRSRFCSLGAGLEPDLAEQDVLEHHPVAGEGIERMLERRRTVLLEKEMPDPGETIAAEQGTQQPPGIAADRSRGQQRKHAAAADEMQPARDAVAVLLEIERIELAETGEATHDFSRCFRRYAART